ncbi:MAG: DUF2851 family protein [Candidatus Marinimicrobia bacterium]|nr:DUF2851 family protein [Candidatus Neomarinimicrobiota bacterium]
MQKIRDSYGEISRLTMCSVGQACLTAGKRYSKMPNQIISGCMSISDAPVYFENALYQWWQRLKPGASLRTVESKVIYILDKGDVNQYDGPDITNVTLLYEDEVLKGDVEFHLKEMDWFRHGHHYNRGYNRVILHIVTVPGRTRGVTSAERMIPTVVVSELGITGVSSNVCKLHKKITPRQLFTQLAPLIYYKWRIKVDGMGEVITTVGSEQGAFYRKCFWALGLKGNGELFEQLARQIPLENIKEVKDKPFLYVTYFEKAGLLDRMPKDVRDLTEMKLGAGVGISSDLSLSPIVGPWEWKRKGIRPTAYPERRLSYGVELVRALLNGWRPWELRSEISFSSLQVKFGECLPGRGWCSEWLGNVVYPFREAVALKQKNYRLDENFNLWKQLKIGYTYGKIDRQFSKYIDQATLNKFAVQQGLLALQTRYCNPRLCDVCPIR